MTCNFQIAIEAISNIRTVASLGCEEIFYKKFIAELGPHQAACRKKSHFRGFMLGLGRSTGMFSYTATLYYGMHLMINASLSSATLFKQVFENYYCFLKDRCNFGSQGDRSSHVRLLVHWKCHGVRFERPAGPNSRRRSFQTVKKSSSHSKF